MSSEFVPIEGKSKRYWITVALIATVVLFGFISFGVSYVEGHQLFGSSNIIPWGMPIVLVIFLIGLSAGLHILAFLIYIMNQDQYRQVIKVAVFLAVVLIFGAMIAIAIDLGRPEKFWRLFLLFYTNNMSSMFAINSIFYTSYFISAFIYLVALLNDMKRFSMVMGMVAFGWAMLTHGGTGAIFGFIAARETWFSALSPFEFIIAAFASSLALLILVLLILFKTTGRNLDWSLISSLTGLTKAFLISLILLMFVGELTHIYSPNRDAIMYMLTGPYSWMFWGFQVFLGIAVPLFILYYPKTKNSIAAVTVASILVVIGIFFKRFYLVIAGGSYPQPFYPGNIEGVYGQIGRFYVMPAEMFLSLGIFAFVALIFILGLKYLEVLPAKEDGKQEAAMLENPSAVAE